MFPIARRAPDKRRFVDALTHRETDEVPFFESEFSPGMMGQILGRQVNVRTYDLPPKDLIELLQRTGIDAAYLATASRFGRIDKRDADGRMIYAGGAINTRSDMANLATPSIEPAIRKIEGFLEAAAGRGIGWVAAVDSSCNVTTAMGYENYYVNLYEDPGFVDELADRYEAYSLPLTEAALALRPDAVFLAVDLCGKNGLTMSPEQAERFVFERLRRQLALVKAAGVPAILHSDGDNSEVMDAWVEMGFSAVHPIEPTSGFDIYDVKKRWGDRLALLGNIDVGGVLGQGTPEEVREDTLRHLEELSVGGGYICGCSHDIDDNIPIENLRAMMDTVLGWRRS